MTAIVPSDQIETIVGVERHRARHYARAVSAEETVYILHSQRCKDAPGDLRDCNFSLALDEGIDLDVWRDSLDQPVRVTINSAFRLIPVVSGMRLKAGDS